MDSKMMNLALFSYLLVVLGGFLEKSTSHAASGPHIADVNLLLPPKMTYPVVYRLQGSDGCFKWSWDHHDILSVLPEYNSSNKCSTSARLQSIAQYSGRKETSVYAADVHTGIVIRCKVFIDKISRIQIFHNSIKLDLDGLATLRIRAFDSEENVFSSLVGLQFMWHLIPEANKLHHQLANVPLKDSPLSDCGGFCGDLDIQIKLEDNGVFSDIFVVKGIEIGHENVSVHMLEPDLKNLADQIVLTVAEAMSLYPPSPVCVLVGSLIPYTLKVIRGNVSQVVELPSPHHLWSVSNASVAKVDTAMGLAQAQNLGTTYVIVEDTRVAGHVQVSSLNVVLPDFLCLYMTPLSSSGDPVEGIESISSMLRWYVVSGHQYLIQMKVFAHGPDAQEIYITENDDVKVYDDQSDYWRTFWVSNSTVAVKLGWRNSKVLKAYSAGLGKLTASLSYHVGHVDRKEVIKVVQEIMVCDQVRFTLDGEGDLSQSILLPWVPSVYQEVELKAIGGCAKAASDYKWLSSDPSTVSVSAFGIVQARKPGKATIKVLSIYDLLNYDEVVVEVSIPSSMVMLRNFPVETTVGSYLHAAVTMKASNGAYFYRCDAFSSLIKWEVGSESFVIVDAIQEWSYLETLNNTQLLACSWGHIYASSPGQAMIHATLSKVYHQFDRSFHEPIAFKASLNVVAYPPLIVCQASDGNQFGGYWYDLSQEANKKLSNLEKLYLVPGSNLNVFLVGGPKPWDKRADLFENVEVFEENALVTDGLLVHPVSTGHTSLYGLFCQTSGSFKILFRRGNLVRDDNPQPLVSKAWLSVTCSFPSSIVLIADEPVNEHEVIKAAILADRSSERLRDVPIIVANRRTIRLSAVGVNDCGEAFANSSSLNLRWELSGCDGLASWDDAYNIMEINQWERFLVLQNESGLCIVRTTLIGLHDSLGYAILPRFPEIKVNLTDAIRLQLVSTLRVDPEFSLLYFNPEAKINLSITGGSCLFEAVTNNSQVVEFIHPPSGLRCLHLLLSPKGLGIANVTVFDIGLTPPLTASALVQVADMEWIKIMSEEISLMEGSIQTVDLLVGTNDGRSFHASQLAYMKISVHIEDQIIELMDLSNPVNGYVCAPSFKIHGRRLGITTLYVSSMKHSGQEVKSQAIKVEVYAPPTMWPQNIFLLPGASYVVTLKGGPTLGVRVEYEIEDDKIATIDRYSGRVSAILIGNTTILARVSVNDNTVICEAHSILSVGVPSTVTLHVQSEQLGIGRELPIYPSFPEGNLFSFYELCKNYHWTVEDRKVGLLTNLSSLLTASEESQDGIYLDENDLGFINVLYGRSAGKTNVAVSFTCEFTTFGSNQQKRFYSSSLSLTVLPDLPLALGVPITWILPPHYTTTSLLPSALESYTQLDSQNRKGTVDYSLLRNSGETNAIFIDGDRIKTTVSNNVACIQAKDHTTGRTEIASCVKVEEVAQIRITSKDVSLRAIDLAVGAELDLPTSYYDVLGNPFYEAYDAVPFYAETNYPDVVCINTSNEVKGKIHLKAIRHGKALMRISISTAPQKSYFMLVRVGAHIHPQNPVLHIGGSLNFTIEGLDDKFSGQWFTTNGSVISLDMLSGTAEALGEGSAQVSFQHGSSKLNTMVTVLRGGDIVYVDSPKEMLTNVQYPSNGYKFSVKLSKNFGAAGRSKKISLDCRVDPPFVGYTKPWLDLDSGNSYCLFFPYSPEHLVQSVPKLGGMRPYITLSIYASLNGANVSGHASALFIGGFSIMEMSKNSMQLNLTPDCNKTSITILGNTDVEISWGRMDLIMVSPIRKEDFGIGGSAQYEVKLLNAKRFEDKITITLPANGQRVEMDISYKPVETASYMSIMNVIGWTIMVGISMLFMYKICVLMSKEVRSWQSTVPATSSNAAPSTPIRGSPVVTDEMSPRTPQPFMDYVRRTIDETPYYRREGRRINPQNTF
ncbi:nuclear pore complex protein GP210 isoform X1 [Senna tora]|uniref:Nuclear pore complex protein GP210 isoform X1 n=1 Tax=Senna tora TaxID=362788 RepID=A0A834W0N1_9FABA|nr:nuclear pore complex protein GP210 isoform X1 [Senna tora]